MILSIHRIKYIYIKKRKGAEVDNILLFMIGFFHIKSALRMLTWRKY